MADGKVDVLEVFDSVKLEYYNTRDQNEEICFSFTNMTEMKMMIETRPRYPSNQFTFTVAKIMKHKAIRYFDIELNLDEQFDIDVDVVLEDSQRNFWTLLFDLCNYYIYFLIIYYILK